MVVLALDTTSRAGSCAVARGATVLREHAGDAARPHDERLPRDLMTLLDAAQVGLDEVDVFAVATGPGSFTGLRIGIATMQGLAFAGGKPLIGISTFDAHARACTAPHLAVWIDAWRGEVYAARYRDGRPIDAPTVGRPEVLASRYDTPVTLAGDGAALHSAVIGDIMGERARLAEPVAPPLAGTIALLADSAARAGHRPPPHVIRPLYVRRPDAELARDARPVR